MLHLKTFESYSLNLSKEFLEDIFYILAEDCGMMYQTYELYPNQLYLITFDMRDVRGTGSDNQKRKVVSVKFYEICEKLKKLNIEIVFDEIVKLKMSSHSAVEAGDNYTYNKLFNIVVMTNDFKKKVFKNGYAESPYPELEEACETDMSIRKMGAENLDIPQVKAKVRVKNMLDHILDVIKWQTPYFKKFNNFDIFRFINGGGEQYIVANPIFNSDFWYFLQYTERYKSIAIISESAMQNMGQGLALNSLVYSVYKNLNREEISTIFNNIINRFNQ